MFCPPYSLCRIDGLWYWNLLSAAGTFIMRSARGFPTEREALADFKWWNSKTR